MPHVAEELVIRPEREADHRAIADVGPAGPAAAGRRDAADQGRARPRRGGRRARRHGRGGPRVLPAVRLRAGDPLGFVSPDPKIPDEAFLVKRLAGYTPDLAGRIVYPAAFEALGG